MQKKFNIESFKKESKGPFSAPEGYFDGFSEKLADRIAARENVGFWRRISFSYRPQIMVPTYLTVLTLAVLLTINVFKPEKITENLAVVDIEETLSIELYSDLSEEMLVEALDEDDLIKEEPTVSENEIIDYLIDEEVELIDIIEEL